jgi:hypothetical protein
VNVPRRLNGVHGPCFIGASLLQFLSKDNPFYCIYGNAFFIGCLRV